MACPGRRATSGAWSQLKRPRWGPDHTCFLSAATEGMELWQDPSPRTWPRLGPCGGRGQAQGVAMATQGSRPGMKREEDFALGVARLHWGVA